MKETVEQELATLADPERAAHSARFFKTGPGEYAEGDVFLGVTVPAQRKVAQRHWRMPLSEVLELLRSPVHEHRLTALHMLRRKYERGGEEDRAAVVDAYLRHLDHVNNWDLVDSSAPYILGQWLLMRDRSVLDELAASGELWRQRTAVLATYAFIREDDFTDTVRLAEMFLDHPHDLMHKAVGWMLRETGKRDVTVLRNFLEAYTEHMPRTMLRYAIEKLDADERKAYLRMRKR